MPAQHFIVATAGHVDHGKSALVQALTGTDPDRLPEEKARGITIDLGFAHLELPAPPIVNLQPSTLSLGLVDVPGHEDFVKNMVAGVGSIDLALFVVAADDGWMPQSEEHLQILEYLGVRHAVVALTKIDLVEGREADAVSRLRQSLRGSVFANATIVGTSIIEDRGIRELKAALSTALASLTPSRDIGKPRLPIDRVFTLRGIGTVVTGTLTGGTFRRNQPVLLQPSGRSTRIRSLQTHNQDAETIGPGTRTALNLPDVAPHADGADGVARGQVVTLAEFGGPANTCDVLIEKSARLLNTKTPAARPLKDGALTRLHHGSGNVPARVVLLDDFPLLPGGRVLAQLRFEQPVFVFGGDRFILRDWAEQTTLGGGIVLDADAARDAFAHSSQRSLLEQRAVAPADAPVWIRTQLARDHAVRRASFLAKTRFSSAELDEAIGLLVRNGEVYRTTDWVADSVWWSKLQQTAIAAVHTAHRDSPEKPGLDVNDLRRVIEAQLPASGLFQALLDDLCGTEFVKAGTAVRHVSHRLALPSRLQAAGARVRTALALKPLEPPATKELAPDALTQQALRFLLDTGEATELSAELVMQSQSFDKARAAIVNFLRERGAATASDLRQHLSTNRRVIIPLLEKLDRDGVTQRKGDARVLR